MSLEQTIYKFLETISEKSVETYRMKINIFYRFLIQEKGINDRSYGSYLEAMKIEEIEESLENYINSNQIKSMSIALHYISVVKRYFNFIYKLGIKNNNLIKSFGLLEEHPDSFQSRIREKILSDPRLQVKDSKQEISLEEAEVLISECDQRIKEIIEENTVLEYKEYASKYNDLMTSIIIKLILYTGITYRAISVTTYSKCQRVAQVA